MAEKLKAAAGSFERVMLPHLNKIDGELKAINSKVDTGFSRIDGRVDGVEKSVSSLRSELKAEIKGVDTKLDVKIDALRTEFRSEFRVISTKLDSIDSKLDTQREIAVLKAKVADLEKRK